MAEKNEIVAVDLPEGDLPKLDSLFAHVAEIIEKRKSRAMSYANREVVLMCWEVGQLINSAVLKNKRAAYGKEILPTLSAKLTERYGGSFSMRNLYRMSKFVEYYPDAEIVSTLPTQLSWSHIVELLSLRSDEARLYYADDVARRLL